MSQALDAALGEFKPSDITPRLCVAMMGVLGVPLPVFTTLTDAGTALMYPPAAVKQADPLADRPEVRNCILIASAIDQGDKGLTLSSGLSTVSSFFFGGKAGLKVDDQQRADAALKALALALLVFRLLKPPPAQQVETLIRMQTGLALLRYFAAVEFALPFADSLKGDAAGAGAQDAGDALEKLIAENLGAAAPKLLSLGGQDGIAGARAVLVSLMPTLKEFARDGVRNVGPVAATVQQYVPSLFGGAKDSLNELVATGADSLPVYRFLVARFVAESVLVEARMTVEPGWSLVPPPAPPPGAPPAADDNPFATPLTAPATAPSAPIPAAAPPASDNPFATPLTAPPAATLAAAAVAATPPPAAAPPANPFAMPLGARTSTIDGAGIVPGERAPAQPDTRSIEQRLAAAPTPPPKPAAAAAPAAPASPPPKPPGSAAPPPPPKRGAPPPPPRRAQAVELPPQPIEPITGAFVHRQGLQESWLLFEEDGRFCTRPDAAPAGRYQRTGGRLLCVWEDGRKLEGAVVVEDYGVVVEGKRYERADFDLTGSTLDGAWRPAQGPGFWFAPDGRFTDLDRPEAGGTYALGPHALTLSWLDGRTDAASFYSDLLPSAASPDVLWVRGVRYDRA